MLKACDFSVKLLFRFSNVKCLVCREGLGCSMGSWEYGDEVWVEGCFSR